MNSPPDILSANCSEGLRNLFPFWACPEHIAAKKLAGIKYLRIFKWDWENELNEILMNPERK